MDLGSNSTAPPGSRSADVSAAATDGCVESRAALLRRAALAGAALTGGALAAAGLPKLAVSAPSRKQDQRIFNFALELEYLLAAFYGEAAAGGALQGELLRLAQVVGEHERAHVTFLENLLGSAARRKPTFDFGDATKTSDQFLRSALLLEETVVAAYVGQGANLTRGKVASFGRLTSVEGRHAAWIRDLLRQNAAPLAADAAKTPEEVAATIRKTGFVKSR